MKELNAAEMAKINGQNGYSLNAGRAKGGDAQGIEFDQALENASRSSSGIQNQEYIPKSHMKAAKGMEEQFLKFMVEKMKQTVDRSKEPSTAMNYYDSVMTEEQTKSLSQDDGGIGIRKMILDQIYPQHLRNEANYNQQQQQKQAGFRKYKDNIEMKNPQENEGFDSIQMKGGDHE